MDRMVTEEREAVRFEGFTLDLRRGALFDAAGAEVPLRPKTFALLTHFLREPGRLQEREAILDAVWPDVTVGDDSLSQAVAELRRALGEAGPRLLRTVPRRGYLFEAAVGEVRPAPSADPAFPDPAPLVPDEATIAPEPRAGAAPSPSARPRGGWWLPAMAAIGGAALAMVAAQWLLRPEPQVAPVPVVSRPAAGEDAPARPALVVPASGEAETPRLRARRLHDEADGVFWAGGNTAENWTRARALYEQAIEADPSYAAPYTGAIFARTNLVLNGFSVNPARDLRDAEELAQRAVALDPESARVHSARAAVLRLQRRFDEALDAYRTAVERDRTQHASRANIGYMNILLGRPEEAFEPIQFTLSLQGTAHPFAGTWYTYLGLAAMHAGRPGHGMEEFRLSLRQPRAFLPAEARHLYVAAALALSGQVSEAREIVQDILRRSPATTLGSLRARSLSDHPEFLRRQEETFLRGLALAGLPD